MGALFVFLTGVALAATPLCPAERIDERAQVDYVHDGDTLHLADGRKLRLIGINTPELAHDGESAEPLARRARERLRELLPRGSKVHLRLGAEPEDSHGRRLAHVFNAQGRNVTAVLLKEGLGFAIAMAPNLWGRSCYFAAERGARMAQRGVWGDGYFRPRAVTELARADTGFRRIQGVVERTGTSSKALWINFDAPVAIRIPKDKLHYFSDNPFQWAGKEIRARGWLSYYRGRWLMHVTHPAMITVGEAPGQ